MLATHSFSTISFIFQVYVNVSRCVAFHMILSFVSVKSKAYNYICSINLDLLYLCFMVESLGKIMRRTTIEQIWIDYTFSYILELLKQYLRLRLRCWPRWFVMFWQRKESGSS
ncbi:hypothetical protein Lalb_Chr03g0027241 [Lupinus albus]|uniref:Uncharacterized protein n=1 Tax=Lupinus albus TaxID=3870 RepID=A0A6A4QQR3_LUPAL|nr:hypothetical protein Lalb_Chr03g0027241 [Lupinus albus]